MIENPASSSTSRAARSDARLIRNTEVQDITGLSRSTIYRLMKENNFPEPVQLTSRAVFWFEDEIRAWARQLRKNRGRPPDKP